MCSKQNRSFRSKHVQHGYRIKRIIIYHANLNVIQKWNNDKCQCSVKGYVWNPTTCSCQYYATNAKLNEVLY